MANKKIKLFHASAAVLGFAGACLAAVLIASSADAVVSPPSATALPDHTHMLKQYCAGCHNDRARTAGMSVEGLQANDLTTQTETWEKILHRLSLGEMPPKGMPRPSHAELGDFTQWLEASLDSNAVAHPNPGRATLRRMNRAEYANAVRDLLDFPVDVSNELPADDSGYGFDDIADVLSVSPTLMDRYIAVAGKIGRLATGLSSTKSFVTQYNIPKDVALKNRGVPAYNERATDDLPLDSRGGGSFQYYAPYDATYLVQAYLNPNTGNDLELSKDNMVEVRLPLKAGLRTIGVSFHKALTLDETVQKPYLSLGATHGVVMPDAPPMPIPLDFQVDRVRVRQVTVPSYAAGPKYNQSNFPRDVLQLVVTGPYDVTGPGDTPSRRRIFICHPTASLSETACARKILSTLARRAYRRPVAAADIAPLMKVYAAGRSDSDFAHGVEAGVEAILVSPHFLFMEERDPPGSLAGAVHPVSDLELATRLSFFLWSSLPDDALLTAAEHGGLHKPAILKQQVARMLADPRAAALTQNFAGQWLYLRNLQYQRPDIAAFPEFDTRLRAAMKTETEMFFASVVRDNRSVLDFINADYTFLNQRLATHYGIPGVNGSTFRKVALDPSEHRGGLLGQGSILTVTSYDNRTSVVKRGKWILDNLLAAPPPPPPPNVPALNEAKNGKLLTVREQMEIHRANPVCASCHTKMDPLGFSLENYDAVGAWRKTDAGQLVDASAVLPDGTKFDGPQGLQDILMSRKDQFVEAFTERLMTYALGRGVEAYDMPAVRAIRRQAASDGYHIDSIIMGIVQSVPFQMKKTSVK